MSQQTTFAELAWKDKGKVTRRERFLAEINAVIPWTSLLALIAPHYPKAGRGRQPLGLEKLLRIHFLQQWFNLSDPQAEDAIYDSESMRRFVGVELGATWFRTRPPFCRFAICWSSISSPKGSSMSCGSCSRSGDCC